MQILILKQTAISGEHFPAGSVVDRDEGTLKQLKAYGKAVALAEANEEQKKLIKPKPAPAGGKEAK